ncbi:MAG: hypothetical protein ACI89J_001454, partial [Hyphomicrobiaceae bacterium]
QSCSGNSQTTFRDVTLRYQQSGLSQLSPRLVLRCRRTVQQELCEPTQKRDAAGRSTISLYQEWLLRCPLERSSTCHAGHPGRLMRLARSCFRSSSNTCARPDQYRFANGVGREAGCHSTHETAQSLGPDVTSHIGAPAAAHIA